jgi:hypothetical protein
LWADVDEFKDKTPFKLGFHVEQSESYKEEENWEQLFAGSLVMQSKELPPKARLDVRRRAGEILTKAWERLDSKTPGPSRWNADDEEIPSTMHDAIRHELAQYTACW